MNLHTEAQVDIQGFAVNDSVQAFVRRRLKMLLFQTNSNLLSENDTTSHSKQLVVDILNASVSYLPGKRKGLFGKRTLNRCVQFHVTVQLLDHNKILFQQTGHKQCFDRVYLKQLSYIEQHGFILGYPDRPAHSDLFSWLEPWLMIGSVCVVIYLFYIIRS
ncbi:hypothetical protein ACFL4L_00085 [bacterium]